MRKPQEEQFVTVTPEAFAPMNANQLLLQAALKRMDGGRAWHKGGCRLGDDVCAVTALGIAVAGQDSGKNRMYEIGLHSGGPYGALCRAAEEISGRCPETLNDQAGSFAVVEAMFLRAIELAA